MGGKSKKATNETPATTTPTQPMQTLQPSMPGQLEAIAQQLGAGFGQPAPDMMSYLQQFYKPMQVPDYSAQPATTPNPAPTPAASTPMNTAQQVRDFLNRQRGGGS
ncbi:hypothetical protein [Aminobacter sp. MDW-2]|uniref:hypothetical protein n=1 Tax=Aminobacter sp. MDW-2 TaxID=2666139 RepID=UPI0012B032C8|nr:hypothetical protein [Aminobacter sp. MDW-2]MRX31918.1 hypothetical protein [Aminobacter sp. MDW-2]QNH32391.1 hypothetical protein H5P29_17730 [Aminobacter sp. MDW-2]